MKLGPLRYLQLRRPSPRNYNHAYGFTPLLGGRQRSFGTDQKQISLVYWRLSFRAEVVTCSQKLRELNIINFNCRFYQSFIRFQDTVESLMKDPDKNRDQILDYLIQLKKYYDRVSCNNVIFVTEQMEAAIEKNPCLSCVMLPIRDMQQELNKEYGISEKQFSIHWDKNMGEHSPLWEVNPCIKTWRAFIFKSKDRKMPVQFSQFIDIVSKTNPGSFFKYTSAELTVGDNNTCGLQPGKMTKDAFLEALLSKGCDVYEFTRMDYSYGDNHVMYVPPYVETGQKLYYAYNIPVKVAAKMVEETDVPYIGVAHFSSEVVERYGMKEYLDVYDRKTFSVSPNPYVLVTFTSENLTKWLISRISEQ